MTLFANNNSSPILEIKRNSDHIKKLFYLLSLINLKTRKRKYTLKIGFMVPITK